MKKTIIKISLISLGLLTVNAVSAQSKLSKIKGKVIAKVPSTVWSTGPISTNRMIPSSPEEKVFNTYNLKPGTYRLRVEIENRTPNNYEAKKLKVTAEGLYNGTTAAGYGYYEDEISVTSFTPTSTSNISITTFIVRQYHSKSNAAAVNYGKVKVTVKKEASTRVNYKVKLIKISDVTTGWHRFPRWNSWNTWRGTTTSKTKSTKTTTEKLSSNDAKIVVNKTGGKGKAVIKVFSSRDKNSSKTLLKKITIAKDAPNGIREIEVEGVYDKFIHVVVDSKSGGRSFKWSIRVYKKHY